jgi:hypothetical protein
MGLRLQLNESTHSPWISRRMIKEWYHEKSKDTIISAWGHNMCKEYGRK